MWSYTLYRNIAAGIFLIIKPSSCTNFSNLFLDWNSTCFGQFLCPSSGVFSLYTQQWYMSYRSANLYDMYHCCVFSENSPDDGQRNCPKHVEFKSKNKFEKLVHLVGFIIRNLSRCTVTWTSNLKQICLHKKLKSPSTRWRRVGWIQV